MRKITVLLVVSVFAAFVAGCGGGQAKLEEGPVKKVDVAKRLEEFAPTEIGVAEAQIPVAERPVIKKLVQAAALIDELYLVQVSKNNLALKQQLEADPARRSELAYFRVMYGPWDRLDENAPFIGSEPKLPGATFYPADLGKAELEQWIAAHPDQKDAFTGYFTVIQRDGAGLKAVPYSEAYKSYLEPAAVLLDEAAGLTKDPRLATYLKARAASFRSNEYRASDMAWMDLGDGALEVVIGPYEVYEDALMGYKAAFEAFITLRDPVETQKLDRIKALIPEMEAYLPIPAELKNTTRGQESPISVVDVLFSAGDTRCGVQTLAFNLPNDEVVREQKGSKKVMLKNVAHAKYNQILMPIAERLLQPDQLPKVSFEAFFNHTLVHETAHGLGPGNITVIRDGKPVATSVNAELKELYATIEEAKADVLGMYLNYFLIEKGLFPAAFAENVYASFLGGFFRSVRFGASEAHGQANVMQFNYLVEKGAVVRSADGRYGYVADKMRPAVESLAHELLMLEAAGDYAGAKAMIDKYGVMPKELAEALAGLKGIPTDIVPSFPTEQLAEKW